MLNLVQHPSVVQGVQFCGNSNPASPELRGTSVSKDGVEDEAVGDEIIFTVEEAPEGGYTARALGESIFTEANDLASLYEMVRDAVCCHFDEGKRPKMIRLRFVREEVIAA